jgi:hypothetical protein
MAAITLSPGQSEALSELREIVRVNDGRIRVESVRDPRQDGSWLEVDLTIECAGETTADSRVGLEDREPVTVFIPARFPFEHPHVTVPHPRFAGLPHVTWANTICLYLAANDWDPARRMHGLVGQLLTWFEAVARGTITGPEVPWHAPVTQQRTDDYLMIGIDLPDPLEHDPGIWLALALVEKLTDGLYRVRHWLSTDRMRDWQDRGDIGHDLDTHAPVFVAPMVALPRPVGFTYPKSREELLTALAGQGLSHRAYDSLRVLARAVNSRIWDEGVSRLLLGPDGTIEGDYQTDRHRGTYGTLSFKESVAS